MSPSPVSSLWILHDAWPAAVLPKLQLTTRMVEQSYRIWILPEG